MMGSFGFAQPIQRRLAFTPAPGAATGASQLSTANPAADPNQAAGFDIKAGLQKLGLLRPPEPGSQLPTVGVTAPAMPSGAAIDDPSAAIASAANSVATGAPSTGYSANGIGDGAGNSDFLTELFGG